MIIHSTFRFTYTCKYDDSPLRHRIRHHFVIVFVTASSLSLLSLRHPFTFICSGLVYKTSDFVLTSPALSWLILPAFCLCSAFSPSRLSASSLSPASLVAICYAAGRSYAVANRVVACIALWDSDWSPKCTKQWLRLTSTVSRCGKCI